jgi:phosphoglycolate phosphatase-like HAD superfamily hydrolase
MLETLVFDLDGTIVDCSARHYACYADLAQEAGCRALGPQAYWSMKRLRRSWSDILRASGAPIDASRFSAAFIERIERPHYLALDRLFPDANDAMQRLGSFAKKKILATMRRSQQALPKQLERLALRDYFDLVIARGSTDITDKGALVQQAMQISSGQCAWIGDTEEDVSGARRIGAFSCIVSCGLRDRALLEAEKPDVIANSLRELVIMLQNKIAVLPHSA